MTKYELAVLYHPDLEADLEKAEQKVTKLVTKLGGKVLATDNWGKRKLEYPIAGSQHAIYVFYEIEIDGQQISEMNNSLNISDEVIRFLITKPDFKARQKAEQMRTKRDQRLAQAQEEEQQKQDEEQ